MGTWGRCGDYLDIRDTKARHLNDLRIKRHMLRRLYKLNGMKENLKLITDINWKIIEVIGQDLDSYYMEYIYPEDDDFHYMLKHS